jgi:hypothetical protein
MMPRKPPTSVKMPPLIMPTLPLLAILLRAVKPVWKSSPKWVPVAVRLEAMPSPLKKPCL